MTGELTSQLSSGLSIKIYGSDVNTLTALSEKVVDIVNSTPGFANATNGLGAGDSTITLKVDRDKVRAYGLTVAEVYQKIAQRLTTTATAQTPRHGERHHHGCPDHGQSGPCHQGKHDGAYL